MKNVLTTKAAPSANVKRYPQRVDGLEFIELVAPASGPGPDAKERLAAYYAKYPLRPLRRGERGIAAALKLDRDRH